MSALSDRLKSLGVQLGASQLPPPRPKTRPEYPVEAVVPGRFQATPEGPVFVAETCWPEQHRHGQAALQVTAALQVMAEWAQDKRVAECAAHTLAFLDTETTGLAGGTGTYAFLVGIGGFVEGQFRLVQLFMRDPVEEPAQLAALAELLPPGGALVTFNGKAFDVPLLNTRYITNGARSPLAGLPHLDLLPLARRLWRDRLPSRALGYLEQHILGVLRTQEDVPGWMIPGLYFDYLRSGDARPLQRVFYHNAMDVLALAALFSHQARLLDDPLNARLEHGLDWVALADLFKELGRLEVAGQLYTLGLAHELPDEARRAAVQRLAWVHRRLGHPAASLELWRQAAGQQQLYAHVELAKYFEHHERDFAQAHHWTQQALDLLTGLPLPEAERRQWRHDLEHRQARLKRRLGRLG